jgi:hypothetical protein
MDPIAFITIVGGIIGIIAGSVQVLDYVEKRRSKQPVIELVQDLQPTQRSLGTSPNPGEPGVAMPTCSQRLLLNPTKIGEKRLMSRFSMDALKNLPS